MKFIFCSGHQINPLPKNIELSKMKAFTDINSCIVQSLIYGLCRIENAVRKAENTDI